jgi:hypothetical protein
VQWETIEYIYVKTPFLSSELWELYSWLRLFMAVKRMFYMKGSYASLVCMILYYSFGLFNSRMHLVACFQNAMVNGHCLERLYI